MTTEPSTEPSTVRRRLILATTIPLLVGAVACGGGGDDDDDAVASLGTDESAEAEGDGNEDGGGGGETPRNSQEFQDAALEYAQCMRDNGIDMPDPEFDGEGGMTIGVGGGPGGPAGGGPDEEEFQAADEECQPIMEDVAPDMQLDPEEQAERQDQMVEAAQCMRDRGYDMPDPQVDENGRVTVQAGPGQDTGPAPGSGEQDEFESDMSECQSEAGMEMPDGAGGASTEEVED